MTHSRPSGPRTAADDVRAVGRNLITWLTVLQAVSVLSAVSSLVLAVVTPGSLASAFGGDASSVPPALRWSITAVEVLVSLASVWALQWTKSWLGHARDWATGGARPDPSRLAREARTLDAWLVFSQWLPLLTTLLVLPLVWYATVLSADLLRTDPGSLGDPQLTQMLQKLSPQEVQRLVFTGAIIGTLMFAVPVIILNYALLGWVRRWLRGVTDAALERPSREGNLRALNLTLARWFTALQALLVILIALMLLVPLTTEAGTLTLTDRLGLLLQFLLCALLIALLQWGKVFITGVTVHALQHAHSPKLQGGQE